MWGEQRKDSFEISCGLQIKRRGGHQAGGGHALTERVSHVGVAGSQPVDPQARSARGDGTSRRRSTHVSGTNAAGARRDVLVTKIRTPRVRSHLVHRERLLAKLEAERARPLTLLCAPAGFGKTTLLVDWLASRRTPDGPPAAVAWLSLDEGDNDPTQFLRFLIAALRAADPRIGATLLEVLNTPPHPSIRAMLTLLVNDLVAAGRDMTLVFEDFHVIRDRVIHDAVAFLLDNPPALLHIVIMTREDPPLPLPRLRVADAVCEVRAADLRFTLKEATAFLEEVMRRRLSPQDLSALVTRTEGWVGGLQLAALSMPKQADEISAFIAGLAGSHRYLLEYLTDEVLARQSPPIVTFLLRTSILDRLNVELCGAVLGEENLDDTRAKLDEVERRNLFLVPLDDERRWYRYHRLFADLLRARLRQTDPVLFADLHNRASRWYEQHAVSGEAIQHSLTAQDFDRAAQMVQSSSLRSIAQGEVQIVLDWYRRLPVPLVESDPRLGIPYAYALMLSNQPDLAKAEMQNVERHLPSDPTSLDARAARGRIALLRAIQAIGNGHLDQTVALAAEAQALLQPQDEVARAFSQLGMAYAFRVSGDVAPASERTLVAATEEAGRLNLPALERVGLSLLARLYMCQGKLRRAEVTFDRAERVIGRHVLMGAPIFHFSRGELLREWNDPRGAETSLQQGIDAISERNGVDAWVAMEGYFSLARLRQAQGDGPGAMGVLDAYARLARRFDVGPQMLDVAAAARARLWLMQGNQTAAARWAAGAGLSSDDAVSYAHETEYKVLARVLIAVKDPAAAPSLNRLLADAERCGRIGGAIEILTLLSLAWYALGDRARAFAALDRALTLGEPEGYVRVFADEGAPMASLLRRARLHGIAPEYTARLLAVIEGGRGGPIASRAVSESAPPSIAPRSPAASALVEPLTEREREVLRLAISGASNQEIARPLAHHHNRHRQTAHAPHLGEVRGAKPYSGHPPRPGPQSRLRLSGLLPHAHRVSAVRHPPRRRVSSSPDGADGLRADRIGNAARALRAVVLCGRARGPGRVERGRRTRPLRETEAVAAHRHLCALHCHGARGPTAQSSPARPHAG